MNMSGIGGFNPAQMQQRMFQKVDADQSGGVSLDEIKKAGPPPGAPKDLDVSSLFSTLDKDGNGELGQSELQPPSGGPTGLSSETLSSLFAGGSEDDSLDQILSLFESDSASGAKDSKSAAADQLSQLIDVLKQLGEDDTTSASSSSSFGSYSTSSVNDIYQTLLQSLNGADRQEAFA